ncbi:MAG: glucosyltransferase domain-containing protein [Clostridia bacterium]|nr:glucosyltransferase domain-containing protein [Clostridia bacterium]
MDDNALGIAAPQGALRRLFEKIPRHILITFTAAFALCLIVHHQAYCKLLLNHDNVGAMFGSDYGAMSGRWLLPLVMMLDGSFSVSWVIGLISALLLSVSACLAVSVMRIRSAIGCIAASALMVTFPSIASNNFYMFSADAYMFSLFLACLGAYLTIKRRNPIWCVVGGICVALSASIYQAYVCVAAAMLVGALIFDLLDGDKKLSDVLKNALKYVIALGVGVAAYYIAAQFAAPESGLVDYMGLADMGIHFGDLPWLIVSAYKYYMEYFISDSFGLHSAPAIAAFCVMVIAAVGVGMFILFRRKLHWQQILLLAALVIVFPLAANLTLIMAAIPAEQIHTLMIFGLCMLPVAAVAMGDYAYSVREQGSKAGRIAATVCVWCVILGAVILSANYALRDNEAYFKSDIVEQQSVAFGNRLLMAVQQTEGYEPGMTTLLIGNSISDYNSTPELEDVGVTGSFNMSDFIRSYGYNLFLQRYCGWEDQIYGDGTEVVDEFSELEEVREMPAYPAEGSTKIVNGVVIVKMS